MPKFLVTWLLSVLALVLTAYLVPGIQIEGFQTAIVAAAVMGLLNATVRPILVLLTLPLTFITLGLFLIVINAITLGLVSLLVPGFTISNLFAGLIGALVLSLITTVLNCLAVQE
jgi:putative membrane protein